MKLITLVASCTILVLVQPAHASTPPNLRFVSPLQCLTIWDEQVKKEFSTPRSRFLPKFRAGLTAEVQTRKALKERNEKALTQLEEQGGDWAKKAAILERRQQREADQLAEQAYDEAIKSFTSQQKAALQDTSSKTVPNKYQFVGVVNKASSSKPVTWYARKKPANAKWSLRLVHVNRDAIIKDLFNRGKVDIFARYKNTGQVDEESNQQIVKTDYVVKERSWRYLHVLFALCRFNCGMPISFHIIVYTQNFMELFTQTLLYGLFRHVLERTPAPGWFIYRRKHCLRVVLSIP